MTAVSPASGPIAGGTSVTITGTGFLTATVVKFGSTGATSHTVNSDTSITATTPAQAAGVVNVVVTNSTGSGTLTNGFTYDTTPTVTAVSPASGPIAGGTSVTITGTGFLTTTAVKFGSTAASSYTVNSDTSITATTPAQSAGVVNVVVTNSTGSGTLTNGFTYDTTPTVTAVSPASGPIVGGTSVTITGTGFLTTTAVKFGSTAATSYTVNSDTQITATAPAHAAGVVNVVVTNSTGSGTLTNGFTYDATPTVTSISPIAGLPAGGTVVTITGTGFLTSTAVKFGSTAAASFTVNSDTQITATSPSGTDGTTVDITVTNPSGTSSTSSADKFTYQNVPTVTTLSPKAGSIAGGTSVTITGTDFYNLSGAAAVKFGANNATSYTVNSGTQITAVAPAGVAGVVNVTVTTPVGTSSTGAGNQYTYDATPTVTAVSPASGPIAGGTSVTITGTGFLTTTAVQFGTTNATSYTVNSDTSITATTPAQSAGVVNVVVTNSTASATLTNGFTYDATPTVTAVSPASGPIAGGTSVTITGTGFLTTTAVKFGSTAATSYTVNSDTQITATSPAQSAGVVNVVVTNSTGSGTLTNGFTYDATPTVTAISPIAGLPAGGTVVTITGTGFLTSTAVKFGSTAAASFTVNSDTQITATSPSGTDGTTVDITVTNPSGTSSTSSADKFTYQNVPTVTTLSPKAGSIAGGTSVTITGTDFYNLSGAAAVKFGANNATSYTVNSGTQITAVAPAGVAGVVNVTVTTPVGTSSTGAGNQYTYDATPTVTAVSPASGPIAGGTSVTITGTGFLTTTAVKFGSTAATSYTVNSDTQITATAPAHAAGVVNVVVTNSTGSGTLTNGFTYDTTPTVTAVSPASGPIAGGTSVTITGTGFLTTTAVKFGSTAATSYTVNSDTQITATSPAQSAGVVNVVVTNSTGSGTLTNGFTYDATPTVTSISPIAGLPAGGTVVTITGTGFLTSTVVKFGSTAAASFTVNSDTQITATSPSGTDGTTVDITVTNPSGTSSTSSADKFTYQNVPTVTTLSPKAGSIAGGTSVTITGTDFYNLSGAAAVKFGANNATSYTVNSGTQITAVAPAGVAGVVNVTVTTPVGTSSTGAGNQYTYDATPTVTAVSPASGPIAGGTSVTITGTGFLTTTAVQFGTTNATSYTVNSDTSITATTPAQSAGVVNVVVTNSTASATLTNGFTYDATPTVTAVSPASGPIAGGTSVTITGTGFLTTTAVKFGSTAATSYTVNSDTQITATSPAQSAGVVNVVVTNSTGSGTLTNGFTYDATPTVTAVSPASGPIAGGTVVTITGTGFLTTTAVKFGSTAATSYTVSSDTQITATSPAQSAGVVNIVVTNSTGSGTLENGFTYDGIPIVTAASPSSSPISGGTSVTILGAGFLTTTSVQFGSTAATAYSINSDTQITATAPAHAAGVVNIVVTNSTGSGTLTNGFTYDGIPTVVSVSPIGGLPAGGDIVTILGTGFLTATDVDFGSNAATSFTVNSDIQITAIAPPGTAGTTVGVTVTNPSGTSAATNFISNTTDYTYQNPPTISSVNPPAGSIGGATSVVITGSGFLTASSVEFGGLNATSYTINSDTQITAITPEHAAGAVDVAITNIIDTGTLTNGYTYDDTPSVTGVSPNAGSSHGGTDVEITGTGFLDETAVYFGDTLATVTSKTDTTIMVASAPPGTGTVNITVVNSNGTSAISSASVYTYDDIPVITTVSPPAGSNAGGTVVLIKGTGFLTATSVQFGGIDATSFTVTSDTRITAITPPGTNGPVTVSVDNVTGTGNSTNAFTYNSSPSITSLSPNAVPATGNVSLTINGTGFIAGTTVYLGSNLVTPASMTETSIVIDSIPAGTGAVYVTIANADGTNAISNAAKLSYVPVVTAITPNVGSGAGGTVVTITGVGMSNALDVYFGEDNPGTVLTNTDTAIMAVAPAGTGQVDITVATAGGTSPTTSADQFSYLPLVTAVTPNGGPSTGDQSVVISGTGFLSATDVQFGSVAASSFTVNSDTQITAITPAHAVGQVGITVTNDVGSYTLANAYTFDTVPTITALNPPATSITGGTSVLITGTGFTTASAVNFGTTPATSFVIHSDTQITAIAPPSTALLINGSTVVNVTVTNSSGTTPETSASEFTYTEAPTITSISPDAGSVGGTTPVMIIGTGFLTVSGASGVQFGTINATSYTVNSDDSITAIAPPQSAGAVTLTVTNSVGSATYSSYTYNNTPSVSSVSPSGGSLNGGTAVTITGTGFTSGTTVYFGEVEAVVQSSSGTTGIVATAPAGTGTVDVTVSNSNGTSATSSVDQFIYYAVPVVTGLSVNSGPAAGGTSVTISGSDFTDVTDVNFGDQPVASFTVVNDSTITAVSPSGAGPVDVQVTTPGGSSAINPNDVFTYNAPSIASLSPNAGSPSGGTSVSIQGVNFTQATSVTWNDTSIPFTFISDAQITVISPVGQGQASVTVNSAGGTSAPVLFNYVPSIASIAPDYGSTSGGTEVTLMGAGFTAGSVVTIGGKSATVLSVSSDGTTITAITPPDPAGQVGVTVTTAGGTANLVSSSLPTCPSTKKGARTHALATTPQERCNASLDNCGIVFTSTPTTPDNLSTANCTNPIQVTYSIENQGITDTVINVDLVNNDSLGQTAVIIDNASTCTDGQTLDALASCNIVLDYQPCESGSLNRDLTITPSSAQWPITASLETTVGTSAFVYCPI